MPTRSAQVDGQVSSVGTKPDACTSTTTSLIVRFGNGRSANVIPAVPAASSVTTIAFIGMCPWFAAASDRPQWSSDCQMISQVDNTGLQVSPLVCSVSKIGSLRPRGQSLLALLANSDSTSRIPAVGSKGPVWAKSAHRHRIVAGNAPLRSSSKRVSRSAGQRTAARVPGIGAGVASGK